MKTILLTKGYNAIVDDGDYDMIQMHKWHAVESVTKHRVYAHHNKLGAMHRFLMSMSDALTIIDHRDGNALNNRRDNLRIVTTEQNQFNRRKCKITRSKYKGVRYVKGRFIEARIQYKKKLIHIGRYPDEISAALAYNEKATELFGEFANLNTIDK